MSVPVVPLSAFSNLAGAALVDDLRRLLANPDLGGLVLFSDTLGEQLALLPVGSGQRYTRIEDLAGVEIEGLRPLCAMQLRAEPAGTTSADSERAKELAKREESLKERERQLDEREALLEQREQALQTEERDFFRRSGELARQTAEAGAGKRAAVEAQG